MAADDPQCSLPGLARPGSPAARPSIQALRAQERRIDRLAWLAMVRADQLRRWQQGDRLPVEVYREQLPLLQTDDDLTLDLIYSEFVVREQLGETPRFEEYCSRFPVFREQLQRLALMHEALFSGSLSPQAGGQLQDPAEPSPTIAYQDQPGAAGPGSVSEAPALSGYRIRGVLGRGGMGIVYKAEQVALKRLVALKMIRAGAAAEPAELSRFRTEAEAVARLQHPNIVQIYEVGSLDGQPFISLEFVEGGSLDRRTAGIPQPPRGAAQLVETLARAMHAAHQQGVVHRDLKPANILLIGGPATPLGQCTPKITDFGLAKRLDAESGQTHSGDILGTPAYMAPEQARGLKAQIGPPADIYALGVILYELLVGKPPFVGGTTYETLEQICGLLPAWPREVQARVPRDLQTICLKCLEKDPTNRYATAEALADDLRAFLSGESIQARSMKLWEWALGRASQRPMAVLAVATGGLIVAGLAVGSLWHSALAFSAVALAGLVVGVGWYYGRLQKALRQLRLEHHQAQRQVERLHLLLELTRQMVAAPDIDSLLRLISETTTRLADAERATIFLFDAGRGEIWAKVALGEGVGEIRLPARGSIAGEVALTGQIINLPDAYADDRFNREVDRRTGYRTRNLLAMPMQDAGGKILGVFQVLNKRGGAFTSEDIQVLSVLAASAAAAWHHWEQQVGAHAAGEPSSATSMLQAVSEVPVPRQS